MRSAFPDAHQRRNGWWANDDNPRFDWLELPNGDIRIHSWTGRTIDTILSMGKIKLTRADLYAKGVISQIIERDKLDLPTLAQYMKIDWQFLESIGYRDGYSYEFNDGCKVTCVKLGGYNNPDGTPYSKNKVRVALHGKSRFYWDAGSPGPAIPCGLDFFLKKSQELGYGLIAEGESDHATGRFHDIPILGISGSQAIESLDVELLAEIPAVYIIEEPDQAHKLGQSGQGFYKDVRKHLRAGGYAGAIFSIRFEDATGYKDPSDLHKAIYNKCEEQAEGPFRDAVHARFVEAIEQAIEQAIPEGNETPRSVQTQQEELNLEAWLWQAVTAKKEVLSDRDIRWCVYLCLYMRKVERGELGWHLDYEQIAFDLDTTPKKVSEVICYLADKVGLFVKHTLAPKEYIGDSEEFRYKGKDVYITPTYTFKRLRDACAPLQDQHISGGPREKSEPAPTCINCGEPTIDTYHLQHCRSCRYDHFQEVDVAPPTFEPVIETTVAILPLVEEEPASQAEEPETPNLRYSGNDILESDRNPQFEVFGNVVPDPTTESAFPSNWTHIEPCETCGCEMANGHGCVRCYPSKDYRLYKAEVNRLYPKKPKVPADAPPEYRINYARLDGGMWEALV
jgi:hypothetical protein